MLPRGHDKWVLLLMIHKTAVFKVFLCQKFTVLCLRSDQGYEMDLDCQESPIVLHPPVINKYSAQHCHEVS